MGDKTMLELAARAAHGEFAAQMIAGGWNPYDDDGDALRLAVKLGIGLLPKADGVRNGTAVCAHGFGWHIWDDEPADPYAAARRAIVRAAAEIGKGMGVGE